MNYYGYKIYKVELVAVTNTENGKEDKTGIRLQFHTASCHDRLKQVTEVKRLMGI